MRCLCRADPEPNMGRPFVVLQPVVLDVFSFDCCCWPWVIVSVVSLLFVIVRYCSRCSLLLLLPVLHSLLLVLIGVVLFSCCC